MERLTDAYLDIETTGLSSFYDIITVIGIYLCNGKDDKLIQLVGEQVTRDNLLEAFEGVNTIYTYNGSRFDLPFIDAFLGIDLLVHFCHHDLMYDCWRNKLYGGFKAVEEQLGIPRQLQGISGLEAVWLWWQYQNGGDQNALALLLQYNKEDVVNLKVLREKLGVETRQRRHTMPICSHSQLSTYEECPLKYKLLYRDRIKRDTEGVEGFPGDDGSRDSEEVL